MIGAGRGSIGVAQQRSHNVHRFPAPLGGVDIRKALGSEDPNTCVYTYNLCPFEYGLRVREGFREWQVGVDNGAAFGVHTLIPFDSDNEGGTADKLFAINNEGIWDVSIEAANPILMVAFPNSDTVAGYGTYAHYTEDTGKTILFYADNVNGLYDYDPSIDTWVATTDIQGAAGGPPLDPLDIKFVVVHKARIWFAEDNSTRGWYLAVGAKQGDATVFYFGSKFRHGGTLEGLFNWTVDGGNGVDDMLVAVGHAGDVIVYKGDDPSISQGSSWDLVGTYYIGEIPNTPRFGSEHGGELYLLSAYGLSSMNDILQGVDSNVLQAGAEGTSIALKIGGLLRDKMKTTLREEGWDVSTIPSEGGILVSVPTVAAAAPIQYYYNIATQGWGIWRGVPMTCFEEYEDSVVFGTADGRIMRMDVPLDNIRLAPPEGEINGEEIEFSILTAYSALGSAGVYKSPVLIRPDFVANREPSHSSVARFDYDISEAINHQAFDPLNSNTGVWDVSNWDQVIWSSSVPDTFNTIGGTWGTGRYIAIATKGQARTTTRLIGWDLIYDTGGIMI